MFVKTARQGNQTEFETQKESQESVIHGMGLAKMIENSDGSQSGTDIVLIFEIDDIGKLYSKRSQ